MRKAMAALAVTTQKVRARRVKATRAIAETIADSMCLPHNTVPVRLPGPGIEVRPTSLAAYSALADYNVGYASRFIMLNSPAAPVWVTQPQTAYSIIWGFTRVDCASTGAAPGRCIATPEPTGFYNTNSQNVLATFRGATYVYFPMADQGGVTSNNPQLVITAQGSDNSRPATSQGAFELDLEFTDGVDVYSWSGQVPAVPTIYMGTTNVGAGWCINMRTNASAARIDMNMCWMRVLSITPGSQDEAPFANFVAGVSGAVITLSCVNLVPPVTASFSLSDNSVGKSVLTPLTESTTISYSDSAIPYRGSRLNAGALLCSNVSKVLDKEGVIRCVRFDSKKHNPFTLQTLAGFVPSQLTQLTLEKGAYSYLLAGDSKTYRNHVEETPTYTTLYASWSDLDTPLNTWPTPRLFLDDLGFCNLMIMSDADTSTVTQLALQWDMHLEFGADSQLFPSGLSVLTTEDFRSAVTALQSTGVFFENPTHFAALAAMVGRAVSSAWPLLAPAARAAALAGAQSLASTIGARIRTYTRQRFGRG